MTKIKSSTDFDTNIQQETVVISIFRAEWCPDCTFIDSFIGDIASEFSSDISTFNVDVDEVPELKAKYHVNGIPSFVAFRGGEEIHRFVSRQRKSEAEIRTFFKESINK